ncbi:MAG: hypothetical protein U1A62_12220, partial [Pseudomonas sp.]|nr:hypothetical protein [Pseudomonas sp.]
CSICSSNARHIAVTARGASSRIKTSKIGLVQPHFGASTCECSGKNHVSSLSSLDDHAMTTFFQRQ